MRRALVTGASGFVGSYLTGELLRRGYAVTATSRRRPALLDQEAFKPVRFVAADVRDAAALAPALEGQDVVFHCAALFDFYARASDLFSVNADGTTNLATLAARAGVERFVNIGSAAVYGKSYKNRLVVETDAPRPTDKYARSKWEQELRAFALNGTGKGKLRVITLRPGAIYGPGSRYGDATALWLVKRGFLFGTPGIGKVISSHVHVRDVVGAAAALAERDDAFLPGAREPHEVAYNVADSSPMFNEDLIAHVAGLIRKKGLIGYWRHVRLPGFLLRLSAYLAELWAFLTRTRPLFEVDSIDYITCGHGIANGKLMATGYALRVPSIVDGISETVRWYEDTDWRVFRGEEDLLYSCVSV